MVRLLCILTISALMISPAAAQERAFGIVNQSGQVIASVAVKAKASVDTLPAVIFQGALVQGDQAFANILIADDACVFDVTIGFADGTQNQRNDIDVCQTDAIVVE